MIEALALLIAGVVAQMTPLPTSPPTPDVPVYSGGAAVRMALEATPLGFDPDGNARWLVVTKFFDSQGRPTRILANSDFDYLSSDGYVQWQTRLAYGQPAAILSTNDAGPLAMTVRANLPRLPSVTVRTNTRDWPQPRVVARSLGPHLVQIGWFPRSRGEVRIARIGESGKSTLLAAIALPSSTYRDTSVRPGARYRYVVERTGLPPVTVTAATPPQPPPTSLRSVTGKGMWLFFTADPLDSIYYEHLDPQAIVAQAVRAGLRYVELRFAYGAHWEITPAAKPTIDAIVDGLAAHGIATIAWTVPRDESFEDLETTIRAAYYRTAKGTPVDGLALDIERGSDFLGDAPQGPGALWNYVRLVREAMGRHYLIVTTVEDPFLEQLTDDDYPYAQIARYSSVLQPMTYWRMLRRTATGPQEVRSILQSSYDTLLRDAQRRIPISIGGQTSAGAPGENPSSEELTASLETAKSIGAIGECFFAWDGTYPQQWNAIEDYAWDVRGYASAPLR
jgi:hypothetical protein